MQKRIEPRLLGVGDSGTPLATGDATFLRVEKRFYFVYKYSNIETNSKLIMKKQRQKVAKASHLRYVLSVATMSLGLLTAGCVTTGQTVALPTLNLPTFDSKAVSSGLSDLFKPKVRELKKLINDGQMNEAEILLSDNLDYFRKEFESAELPEEIKRIGPYLYEKKYKTTFDALILNLSSISTIEDPSTWRALSVAISNAEQLLKSSKQDPILLISRFDNPQAKSLETLLNNVYLTAARNKNRLIYTTFQIVLSQPDSSVPYIGRDNYSSIDYQNNADFQEKVTEKVFGYERRDELKREALKYTNVLSKKSKAAVDETYFKLLKTEINQDGKINFNDIVLLSNEKTPFEGYEDQIRGLVNVGYVDLTATALKNRNIFDFKIAFNEDLKIKTSNAESVFFADGNIEDYDFVFITDLQQAKINREFGDKKNISSKFKSGEQVVPNPDYARASINYQQAMQRAQVAEMRANQPDTCMGNVYCQIAQSGARAGAAIAAGIATSRAREAGNLLANTPQTLTKPVYSNYQYQTVQINSEKVYDVNFYIIDVKSKITYSSAFSGQARSTYETVFNVNPDDPAQSSIISRYKSEDDVTSWEKNEISIQLSALFNDKNLLSAESTTFTSAEDFLAPISARSYADSNPTYKGSQAIEKGSPSSQVIADERFDSVVIIKTPKGIGTGFYVTPDLILTAFHVVDGSALTEVGAFDGTTSYGKVIDYDVRLDLALIKAQRVGKPLKIHTGAIRLGSTVEAIGHPKGFEFTISRGVVSAVRKQKDVMLGSNSLVEFVQTDTPISPGNSGGPLLLGDSVIGVNDWVRVDKASQNLNFSVSFNEIKSYLDKFNRGTR